MRHQNGFGPILDWYRVAISFEMALKIFAQFDDEHDLTRTHPPFDYLLVQNYSVLLARGHYRAS
jgi:hypothetical protein